MILTLSDAPLVVTVPQEDITCFTLTANPFGLSTHHITTHGYRPTLGLNFYISSDNNRLILGSTPTTPCARIPKWKKELKHSILISVTGTTVSTKVETNTIVKVFRLA